MLTIVIVVLVGFHYYYIGLANYETETNENVSFARKYKNFYKNIWETIKSKFKTLSF